MQSFLALEHRVTLEEISEAEKSSLCEELVTLSNELLTQKDSMCESLKIQKIARVEEIKKRLRGGPLPD